MHFGPILLASIATPTGVLSLSMTYSHAANSGTLGKGWKLSWEGAARVNGDQVAVGLGTGATVAFSKPVQHALDETTANSSAYPAAAQVTTALSGANLGFYFAKIGEQADPSCPPSSSCALVPTLAPRVAFADGSRLVYSALAADGTATLVRFEDRYGNVQQLFAVNFSGSRGFPGAIAQGPRRLALQYTGNFDPLTSAFTPNGATLKAIVGSFEQPRVRLALDADGYLTDVCALDGAAPARQCLAAGETTTGCDRAGERSLWRFKYAAVPGDLSGLKRMTLAMDETCAVIERHEYQTLLGGEVVATRAQTPGSDKTLVFNGRESISHVGITSALRPASPPAGSLQAVSTSAIALIDAAHERVASTDHTCGCGADVSRQWGFDSSGSSRVLSVTTGTTFRSKVSFDRNLGGPEDPFRYGLPISERREDWSTFASPARTTSYAYRHPLLRVPTLVVEPGPGQGLPSTERSYDYDDDDPLGPCRAGVLPTSGNRDLPNEAPTRFLCRVVEQGYSPQAARGKRITRFKYDSKGRLLARTGPAGDLTQWSYYSDTDANALLAGMLKTVTRVGDGVSLTTSYDAYFYTGAPTLVRLPSGESEGMAYDARGRLTVRTGTDAATTQTDWETDGKPSRVVLPRGNSIHYEYGTGAEELGRLKQVTWRSSAASSSPEVQHRTFLYDRAGNVLLQEDFRGAKPNRPMVRDRRSQRDYDEAHRVVRELGAKGTRLHEYLDGLRRKSTDEAGETTTWEYDGFGEMRSVLAPHSTKTFFEFNPRGSLSKVIDPNANATRYEYNGFDDLLSVDSPDTGRTTYSYTNDGLVESTRDAEADLRLEELVTEYDLLRRRTKLKRRFMLTPPCPLLNCTGTADLVTWAYDSGPRGLGKLSSVVDESGTTTYGFDTAGRLGTETHARAGLGRTLVLGYSYFPGGQLQAVDYPSTTAGGAAQRYEVTLGGDDETEQVRFNGAVVAAAVDHHSFGAGLRSFVRGNGLSTIYEQDLDGARTKVLGAPLSMTYALDARGLPTSILESGDSQRSSTFGYDGLMRLTSAFQTGGVSPFFTEAYSYDGAGNREKKVRTDARGTKTSSATST